MRGENGGTGQKTRFDAAFRTHVGLVREVNEDRVLLQPSAGLWAVADGMGGHSMGDRAAAAVISALSDIGAAMVSEPAIEAALQSANTSIIDMGRQAGASCGSTVAGLCIMQGTGFVFWVGDSRVYRLREGKLIRLTIDHSFVQELQDAGVLTEQQARSDRRNNIITRAIGVGDDLTVDVASITVQQGDLFLICSDGLSDLVPDDVIAGVLDEDEIEDRVDALIRAALTAGGTDNVSAVLVATGSLKIG